MTATKTPPDLALKVHTRRAERALDELANEVRVIRHRIEAGTAEADDTRKTGDLLAVIAGHLGAIETLREITGGEQS